MEGLSNNSIEYKEEDDFVFLSEEELSRLSDDELSDYNSKLEKKAESDNIEYFNKNPEINQKELDEEWKKKLDELYKKDPDEPRWQR